MSPVCYTVIGANVERYVEILALAYDKYSWEVW